MYNKLLRIVPKALIFFFFIFQHQLLFGQASCHTPVDGPFFESTVAGGETTTQLLAKDQCYALPPGTGTMTVCYRYTYPTAGTVQFKTAFRLGCSDCNYNFSAA